MKKTRKDIEIQLMADKHDLEAPKGMPPTLPSHLSNFPC